MTPTRYALELAYRGTNYAGWQRQPNALSVEETVDTALGTVLGQPIKLVGCGRTDTGVHASYYVAHFDFSGEIPSGLLYRLNRFLPDDVALRALYAVDAEFHARFQATSRAYTYRITTGKDPFRTDTAALVPKLEDIDREKVKAAAALICEYGAFAPFCKSNSDAYTMDCQLMDSRWEFGPNEWVYRISANRFLRGMVRLIVGMCLQVGRGNLTLNEVKQALDRQQRLTKPWSAPAEGLFLSAVNYPDRSEWQRLM